MENLSAGSSRLAESRMGKIALSCTVDLPELQRKLVLERVERRLPQERPTSESRVVEIVIEETLFVEACM